MAALRRYYQARTVPADMHAFLHPTNGFRGDARLLPESAARSMAEMLA